LLLALQGGDAAPAAISSGGATPNLQQSPCYFPASGKPAWHAVWHETRVPAVPTPPSTAADNSSGGSDEDSEASTEEEDDDMWQHRTMVLQANTSVPFHHELFQPSSSSSSSSSRSSSSSSSSGKWTHRERILFVLGMSRHGRDFARIAQVVGRSAAETASYADRYFLPVAAGAAVPSEPEHALEVRTTSRYYGVTAVRSRKGGTTSSRWQSKIWRKGRLYHLGRYGTELEAAAAFDRGAREHGVVGAMLNFAEELTRVGAVVDVRAVEHAADAGESGTNPLHSSPATVIPDKKVRGSTSQAAAASPTCLLRTGASLILPHPPARAVCRRRPNLQGRAFAKIRAYVASLPETAREPPSVEALEAESMGLTVAQMRVRRERAANEAKLAAERQARAGLKTRGAIRMRSRARVSVLVQQCGLVPCCAAEEDASTSNNKRGHDRFFGASDDLRAPKMAKIDFVSLLPRGGDQLAPPQFVSGARVVNPNGVAGTITRTGIQGS
jgi:hypothetical protein